MTEAEHLQVAQRLIVLAEGHQREGDDVAMAEMLSFSLILSDGTRGAVRV